MTARQALTKIERSKTQVFNMSVKQLYKKEWAVLNKLVEEKENE